MKVERIEIKNFKKIDSVNLSLSDVNYLVGGNNAGKSSVLQGIHMAVSCAKLSVERREQVIPESELRYSPTSEFTLLGHTAPYENKKSGSRGIVEFFGKTSDDADASYRIEIYKGRNYGNIGVDRAGVSQNFGQNIVDPKKLFSVFVPGISGIPHKEEFKSYASVFQKVAGGDANLVFRNVIRLLQERERLGEVKALMVDLIGPFDIRLNHTPETDTYLNVEVSVSGEKFVPLDLVGTGVLQILQIVSYVALFSPAILLIDEPDNHLHPSRQIVLAKAFSKISKNYGATVIVSTHSRHLVTAADSDAKIIWMRDGAVESDDCRDLAAVMMDLGALDQIDSNGAECIICTEDRGKKALVATIEELGLGERVKVISYNGINNAGSAVAIGAMCELFPNTPKVVIHRDRDFLLDDEVDAWGREYLSRGMNIFAPTLCDIEAYYCTAEHVATVYDIANDQAVELVERALEEVADDLVAKFREKRREANVKYWRDGGGPATVELWPEGAAPKAEQVYGKKMRSKLNDLLPSSLGGQRIDLQGTVSRQLVQEVRSMLESIGIVPMG